MGKNKKGKKQQKTEKKVDEKPTVDLDAGAVEDDEKTHESSETIVVNVDAFEPSTELMVSALVNEMLDIVAATVTTVPTILPTVISTHESEVDGNELVDELIEISTEMISTGSAALEETVSDIVFEDSDIVSEVVPVIMPVIAEPKEKVVTTPRFSFTNPVLLAFQANLVLLLKNSPSLTTLSINNLKLSANLISQLCEGLSTNTHLKSLSIVHCSLLTSQGCDIATSLASNHTLTSLTLSSNILLSPALKKFATLLAKNHTLKTLMLDNQRNGTTGSEAEEAFANAFERNVGIVKLGLVIVGKAARGRIDLSVMRNREMVRKALRATTE